jgi:uncharacterized protein (TIGR02145 family)
MGGKWGKLYNWFAVNDSRGLAPDGWHIPSDIDWDILTAYLGGADNAEDKMKITNEWEGHNETNDNWILQKSWGVSFVKLYYHYGAIPAKLIEKSFV